MHGQQNIKIWKHYFVNYAYGIFKTKQEFPCRCSHHSASAPPLPFTALCRHTDRNTDFNPFAALVQPWVRTNVEQTFHEFKCSVCLVTLQTVPVSPPAFFAFPCSLQDLDKTQHSIYRHWQHQTLPLREQESPDFVSRAFTYRKYILSQSAPSTVCQDSKCSDRHDTITL